MVNNSLLLTSEATTHITTIILSTPISIYFLSFINYYILCSLYVLLNFPIPEQIYRYLSLVYNQINVNLLSLFGDPIAISALGEERVNSDRATFFNISSEVLSSNIVAFIFMVGNIVIILALQFLTSFLRKNNYMRKLVGSNK